MLTVEHRRETLDTILEADDPAPGLWELVNEGIVDEVVPELSALRLEQDPIHRHKDVLAHTIAVVSQTRPQHTLRLAALFHDIGKPITRSFDHGGVTFRHHEAVGAKITRRRLKELTYPKQVVTDVAELVRLSGRFKGYADGWSDAAVRRYARDAGHLLGLLNELVRSDCTTRNPRKRVELQNHVDEIEQRIADLAEQARRDAERPLIDGNEVMERLGIGAGRDVGQALRFLLELRRTHPDLDREGTEIRLDEWWAARQSG